VERAAEGQAEQWELDWELAPESAIGRTASSVRVAARRAAAFALGPGSGSGLTAEIDALPKIRCLQREGLPP